MSRWKSWVRMVLTLSVFVSAVQSHAAQQPYGKGILKDIQEKTREKVDMYLVNTPVTSLVPYFQVAVDLGDYTYLAEYTPPHAGEGLPEVWKVGETWRAKWTSITYTCSARTVPKCSGALLKKTPVSPKQSKE